MTHKMEIEYVKDHIISHYICMWCLSFYASYFA
jgi:hypothetical protein